jgi:hypothetical protein
VIVTINVAVLLAIIIVVRLRRTTHSRSRFDEKMTVVICLTFGVLIAPTAFGKSILDVVTNDPGLTRPTASGPPYEPGSSWVCWVLGPAFSQADARCAPELGPGSSWVRGSVSSAPICVINPPFSQVAVTICVTVQLCHLCHRAGFVRPADRRRTPAIP